MGFLNARLKAGLSQTVAARKLGISAASVCQWETGRTVPDAKRLPDIANLYGCTIDALLAQDDQQNNKKETN